MENLRLSARVQHHFQVVLIFSLLYAFCIIRNELHANGICSGNSGFMSRRLVSALVPKIISQQHLSDFISIPIELYFVAPLCDWPYIVIAKKLWPMRLHIEHCKDCKWAKVFEFSMRQCCCRPSHKWLHPLPWTRLARLGELSFHPEALRRTLGLPLELPERPVPRLLEV